jgi:TM2 domain-containing membrane protein YozV
VFIVLGLFLGCLGIHNFYAGYSAKGAVQLAVTLVLG